MKASYKLLKTLIESKLDIDIVGVVTKQNSDFNSDFCDLSILCEKNEINYFYTGNVNDLATEEYIRSKKPDIIYCFGWSQLIKRNILSIPKYGVIGFHPADLPKNRGRHPIIWALVLGLEYTASTFFIMDKGADSGDIISKERVKISQEDDANILYNKIMNIAEKQVKIFTEQFINGKIKAVQQNEKEATYWRKRKKEDGFIDWRMSSKNIYNLVRALTKPYVGASFYYKNGEIKVWKAQIIYDSDSNKYLNVEYGKVIKVFDNNEFIVKTGDGLIKILESDVKEINEGEYLS